MMGEADFDEPDDDEENPKFTSAIEDLRRKSEHFFLTMNEKFY